MLPRLLKMLKILFAVEVPGRPPTEPSRLPAAGGAGARLTTSLRRQRKALALDASVGVQACLAH